MEGSGIGSTIDVAPDLREWTAIRQWLESFCLASGIGRDIRLKLELAAEEWFINVVTHGFAGKGDAGRDSQDAAEPLVRLGIGRKRDEGILELVDNGPAYNPLERKDPDITLPVEQRPIGGLGIYLIKNLMDSCRYERLDGCNRLTLRKRIANKSRQPSEGGNEPDDAGSGT